MSLRGGAQIQTSTYGKGNAGNLTIQAQHGAVLLDGVGSVGNTSGILSQVGTGGIGKGGNINLEAASLSVTNGAKLASNYLRSGQSRAMFSLSSATLPALMVLLLMVALAVAHLVQLI